MLVHLIKRVVRGSENDQTVNLTRKVWFATGIPISLVIMFLMSFLVYSELRKKAKEDSEGLAFLSNELNSQNGLITNELYLGQWRALELRL